MSHLSRSTVSDCLNSLREKKLIIWIRGGRTGARGKGGMMLSNDYSINKEELDRFQSKKDGENQGELVMIKNLTAYLMSLFKAEIPIGKSADSNEQR